MSKQAYNVMYIHDRSSPHGTTSHLERILEAGFTHGFQFMLLC